MKIGIKLMPAQNIKRYKGGKGCVKMEGSIKMKVVKTCKEG